MTVLNVAMPSDDPCCSEPLNAAMLTGMLDAVTDWECPKCGCPWKPEEKWNLRVWKPQEWSAISPPR